MFSITSKNPLWTKVLYKYEQRKFIANISSHKNNNETKSADISNLDLSQINIDREVFIKSVLENIIKPLKPSIEPDPPPENVVIDFSSPNIAKPFHMGHLRSTIIGNFIANIHKYFHNNVTKINYLGDWGTQFGLLQYGLQAKNIKLEDLKHDPIKKLFEAYVFANKLSVTDESIQQKAREYFTSIEQGTANLDSWKQIRNLTIQEIEKVYKRLGIQFDTYHWESDYNGGAIKHTLQTLEEKNIISVDVSGKKVAKVNNRNVTVLKSDNSTLYISRDIAALLDRFEKYKFDKMLYIVDNSQTDHFEAVFDIVKQINAECAEGCKHIKFGRIKGMSTRSGNVVFLNDILDEAKQKMYDKQLKSKNTRSSAMNENTCDILGTSAVIINDLKQRRHRDYTFDWERALQSEGDSGIKLQYLHCRLCSLEKNNNHIILPKQYEPNCLPEDIVKDVIQDLAKFQSILYRSLCEYEACIIVNYLFRLSKHVNRMFNELNIKSASHDIAAQRLLVFHAARLIVKTGLEILGVKPLTEM